MNEKHKIKISSQPNYFEEAVFLVVKAAQWQGDFNKEDFHLIERSEHFVKTQEESEKIGRASCRERV